MNTEKFTIGSKWEHQDKFGNQRIAEIVAHHNGHIVVKLSPGGYHAVPEKSLIELTPEREKLLHRYSRLNRC